MLPVSFVLVLSNLAAGGENPSEVPKGLPPVVADVLRTRPERAVQVKVATYEVVPQVRKRLVAVCVLVQPGGPCRRPYYATQFVEVEELVYVQVQVEKTVSRSERWDGTGTVGYFTLGNLPELSGVRIDALHGRFKELMRDKGMLGVTPTQGDDRPKDILDRETDEAYVESQWFRDPADPAKEFQLFAWLFVAPGREKNSNLVVIDLRVRERLIGTRGTPGKPTPEVAKGILERMVAPFPHKVSVP